MRFQILMPIIAVAAILALALLPTSNSAPAIPATLVPLIVMLGDVIVLI